MKKEEGGWADREVLCCGRAASSSPSLRNHLRARRVERRESTAATPPPLVSLQLLFCLHPGKQRNISVHPTKSRGVGDAYVPG